MNYNLNYNCHVIILQVAEYNGVLPRLVFSNTRVKNIVLARHEACYIASKIFKIGTSVIAAALGELHYGSVVWAAAKIAKSCEESQEYSDKLKDIAFRINERLSPQ